MVTILCVLSLVAVALWAGLRAASSPDVIARLLEQALGRPVRLSGVELALGRKLEIELRGLRIFDAAPTSEAPEELGAPALRIPRAAGTLSWRKLLDGEWTPLEWKLEAPVAILRGAGTSPVPELPDLPLELWVERGVLEWQPENGPPLRVEDLELRARSGNPGGTLRGTARGRLVQEATAAPVEVEFEHEDGAWSIRAEVAGLALAGFVRQLGIDPAPTGNASGHIAISHMAGIWEGSVELGIDRFSLELPKLSGPIAPADARIELAARFEGDAIEIRARRVQLDDLIVSGELAVSPGPKRRVRGHLEFADFRPGEPGNRVQFLRLVGLRHESWSDFDARTEGGLMEEVKLELDLGLDQLGDAFAYDMKPAPGELRLSARVRDGIYRPQPGVSPLEQISGEIELVGNQLEIRDLEIWRDGEALPRIEVRVDGMHRLAHLPKHARKTPPGPGVPIPGLGTAFRAMQTKSEGERAPTAVHLRHFDLAYPAFVLELRDANGIVDFPNGNIRLREARGSLGGAPARISALWKREEDRVSVEIVYGDGPARAHRRPRPDPPAPYSWAEGEFRIETAHFGDWRVDGLEGQLRADGADVAFRELRGSMANGRIEGRGHLSLPSAEGVPLSLEFDSRDAEVKELLGFIGLPDDTLSGTASANGSVAGVLMPGRSFLSEGNANVSIRVADGTVEKLPAWVLLARLATPLGWRGLIGRPLPFSEIRAQIRIDRGILHTDRFELLGPELRVIAAGDLDLVSAEHETDLVVAVLFLETVDRVLRKVPLLGPLVLGEDENLIALYFQVEGPWEHPDGRYLPPAAIQNAVGLGGRVVRGVGQLRDLLLRQNSPGSRQYSEETNAHRLAR